MLNRDAGSIGVFGACEFVQLKRDDLRPFTSRTRWVFPPGARALEISVIDGVEDLRFWSCSDPDMDGEFDARPGPSIGSTGELDAILALRVFDMDGRYGC